MITQSDLNDSIVINAKITLTITPDGLSHVIIYQQSADENPQQALEKVFHGMVKFRFSTELFLDPSDLYQSDAFEKGQRRIKNLPYTRATVDQS